MGSRFSILKNTLALAVPNVLNPAVSFILVLVISRHLGVEGLGKYSLVFSYLGIFSTLASMGLASLVVRETARRPEDTHLFFFNAGVFGAVSSLVSLVGMDLLVAIMGYDKEVVHGAFLCSFSVVFSTGIGYLEAIFRSSEKSQYVALTHFLENLVKVGSCIALVLTGHGIVPLFGAILGARVFGFCFLFFLYVRVFGRPRARFSPEIQRLLAREAPTFLSIAIFSAVHMSIDQILLSKLKSIESVGIYSAADKLLAVCRTLPLAFSAALLPFLTKRFGDDVRDLAGLTTDSLRYLYLGCLPIVVGTIVLADIIIGLVYGWKFAASAGVLRVHILSLIPFSTVYILAELLVATDNQRVDLSINIFAAFMNFGLNFLLIPHFAEIGAALAALITITIFNHLQYWYIKRRLFPVSFARILMRPLLAALGMAVVTYVLREWNFFLNVIVSAAVYGALLLVFKAITRDEIDSLGALIRHGFGKREV